MSSLSISEEVTLTTEEEQRYSRHLMLDEIGQAGQLQLKAARVLVVGAGGLGCPSLLYLVAAGVGTIGIVDDDVVQLSNLARQVLYNTCEVGASKSEMAAKRLGAQNPHCQLQTHAARLHPGNARALMEPYEVVLDCTDNFATRLLLNDVCIQTQKPLIHGSVQRFKGCVSVFGHHAQDPCYRCLFPDLNAADQGARPGGLVGMLPAVIGALQAMEALKVITGIGRPLRGRVLYYDALQSSFREFTLLKDPGCPACGQGGR